MDQQSNFFLKSTAITIILIVLDQLSKYLIRSQGGFYICNKGVAFGLQLPNYLAYLLIALFLLMGAGLIQKSKSKVQNYNSQPKADPPLAEKFKIFPNFFSFDLFRVSSCKLRVANIFWILLILSGGISNIIDRIHFGCVIDFIDLGFWPVFNLADIFITIGAIILIYNNVSKKHQSFEL